MALDAREQTLAHLRLVAAFPGFWELRALQRFDDSRMESRGSFFIIATAAADSLIYDRLEQAVDWADEQAHRGAEIFYRHESPHERGQEQGCRVGGDVLLPRSGPGRR
jgi:hypothetical protein